VTKDSKICCAIAFLGLLSACSNELERIPDVRLVADVGTPENAELLVQDLAARSSLELRDTMVGVDGYELFLLGNNESRVLIASRVDCPRPDAESYFVRISITSDSPSREVPASTVELVRKHFPTAISAREDQPNCQP
jgi:hypothetical protein